MSAEDRKDEGGADFIRDAVARDIAEGRTGVVRTRFPPEPNGWTGIVSRDLAS